MFWLGGLRSSVAELWSRGFALKPVFRAAELLIANPGNFPTYCAEVRNPPVPCSPLETFPLFPSRSLFSSYTARPSFALCPSFAFFRPVPLLHFQSDWVDLFWGDIISRSACRTTRRPASRKYCNSINPETRKTLCLPRQPSAPHRGPIREKKVAITLRLSIVELWKKNRSSRRFSQDQGPPLTEAWISNSYM